MPASDNKLVDLLSEGTVKLVEGSGDKIGKIYVRGEFGRSDKPTANNRLYPPKIWESQIERLRPNLESRKVLGELDHPSDGRTSLQRASHVITGLQLEDGVVIGEAEILDTQMGRDLKAIFKAGVPVGISSRGYGSVKENAKGESVVQEDYRLVTFDFVAEPADSTAYPEVFYEGVEFPMAVVQEAKSDEELAKRFAEVVLGEKNRMADADKVQISAELLAKLAEMKSEIRDQVRVELLADPAIGRARSAVDAVKEALADFLVDDVAKVTLAKKDEEIAALNGKLAEATQKIEKQEAIIGSLAKAAKEAGYRFHMERLVGEDKNASFIRNEVGDVTKFASVKDLTEAVSSARSKLTAKLEEEEQLEAETRKREQALERTNSKLENGLRESLSLNKELALKLYSQNKLTNHPDAVKILAALKHVTLESKEQIDELIDGLTESMQRSDDEIEEARARVRKTVRGGLGNRGENDRVEESVDRRTSARGKTTRGNYLNLGVPLNDLRRLSGIR